MFHIFSMYFLYHELWPVSWFTPRSLQQQQSKKQSGGSGAGGGAMFSLLAAQIKKYDGHSYSMVSK
jgi:hypothetical protein